MTTQSELPEWVKYIQDHSRDCSEADDLLKALTIAIEALEKIEQRKLENLPNDKKRDEFHKTLMASLAWFFCGYTARDALRRIREIGESK